MKKRSESFWRSLKLKSLDKLQLKKFQNLKAFCHWIIEINSCKLHMIYDQSRVNFHWSWFHIERHLRSHKSKLTRKPERIYEPQHKSSEYGNQKLQLNPQSSWTSKLWSYQTFWSAELWIEKALKLQKSTEFHTKAKVKVRFRLSFNFIASRNFFRRARDLLHFLDHELC